MLEITITSFVHHLREGKATEEEQKICAIILDALLKERASKEKVESDE